MKIIPLSFACFCSFSGVALADTTWAIQPDWANCFLDNIDAYQASEDDPIVIVLAACPEVDRMAALRKLQQNSGALPPGPSVFILPDGTERTEDEIIVYSRDELGCLNNLDILTSNAPVLLPQSPCDQ